MAMNPDLTRIEPDPRMRRLICWLFVVTCAAFGAAALFSFLGI